MLLKTLLTSDLTEKIKGRRDIYREDVKTNVEKIPTAWSRRVKEKDPIWSD